ncbi:RNA-directed DNA polymerase, eukaryota [Tanacetum coccineum]
MQARNSFQMHEGVAYWFDVIKDWYAEFKVDERVAWVDIEGLPSVAWTQKHASESDTDVESEGSEASLHYTDICSDDPFGIYDLLNQKVAEKEIEQVVSDDSSHPPGFTKDVELEQKVGEVDINVDKEGGFNETFKLVSQLGVSRSNDGKQSVDKSETRVGISKSFVPCSLVCGKQPRVESSLLDKLNDFVEIGQAMGFSMEGIWTFTGDRMLMIGVYAPQEILEKRLLCDYLHGVLDRWKGEVILMGDFNEVRMPSARHGSVFNKQRAALFNSFILSPNDSVTDAIDRHLSDHRVVVDSWQLDVVTGDNAMTCLKKKFQALKGKLREWSHASRSESNDIKLKIQMEIQNIDRQLDMGECGEDILSTRRLLCKELLDIDNVKVKELAQKAKVKWAIRGDENSEFFYGIINKRRHQMAIRGVLVMDLESNISEDEIRKAVWDCDVDKSPGPDGFTFELIRKFWDVVRLVKDYRPISLIGCQYKIVGKILANRLSMVIDGLIINEQSAFIRGRQILDGPMILNETIAWCNYKKKKSMVFKVDFEKAYDSIRWDFLDEIMLKFDFGPKWRGDPLSPFLLLLIMESLHISFSKAMHQGFFKGIRISSNDTVCLSHLYYADDAVFIGEWNEENLLNIVKILQCFFLASGLCINLHKCSIIGVGGVKTEEVLRKATLIGCDIGETPFKYLGVMVGTSMLKIKACDMIVDKISARLSKWKVKTLSIGGHLTLIMSVLGSLPTYYFSLFKVPSGVLKNLESLRSNFFRCNVRGDRKLALAIHDFHGSLDRIPPSSKSSTWIECVKGMIQLNKNGVDFMSFVSKRVGDGDKTMFWLDPWLDGKLLKNDYPRLFALEGRKEVSVGHKLVNGLYSRFRIDPGGVESSQMEDLHKITHFVKLTTNPDCWVWSLNPSGLFSVASARKFIEEQLSICSGTPTRWIKLVPIKVNILAWRLALDKLPTRLTMSLRGLELPSIHFPVCNSNVESTSHLFFACNVARDISSNILMWRGLPVASYQDWNGWIDSLKLQKEVKEYLEATFLVAWWHIWRYRNSVIFTSIIPKKATLFDNIVSQSFAWCNVRAKRKFSWVSWLQSMMLTFM